MVNYYGSSLFFGMYFLCFISISIVNQNKLSFLEYYLFFVCLFVSHSGCKILNHTHTLGHKLIILKSLNSFSNSSDDIYGFALNWTCTIDWFNADGNKLSIDETFNDHWTTNQPTKQTIMFHIFRTSIIIIIMEWPLVFNSFFFVLSMLNVDYCYIFFVGHRFLITQSDLV